MEEKIILIFHDVEKKQEYDLEVPSDLTANELVYALNQGLTLGIDIKDISQCYLKSTNPIALLRGNKKLSEYGLHHGTDIWYDR